MDHCADYHPLLLLWKRRGLREFLRLRERLRLYFDRVDVMAVESGGEGKGASVTIRVPVLRGDAVTDKGAGNVQDSDSR